MGCGCGENPTTGISTVLHTEEHQQGCIIYEIRRLRYDIFSIVLETGTQLKVGSLLYFDGVFSFVVNSQAHRVKIFLKSQEHNKLAIDYQFIPQVISIDPPKFNSQSVVISHELSTSLAFYFDKVNGGSYYHMISCHSPDNLIYADKYSAKSNRLKVLCTNTCQTKNVISKTLPTRIIQQLMCMGFEDLIVIGPVWLLTLIQLYVKATDFLGNVHGLYYLYGKTEIIDYRWLDLKEDSLVQLVEFDVCEIEYQQKLERNQYQEEVDEELEGLISKLQFSSKQLPQEPKESKDIQLVK
ncbi:hypothetical protein SS50377_22453 [Spironucleus salmonicida]|uniref:Uncharacterized protein n=1 Tax=Spironucleus salmonicida TaxID=348837 RepID=V6LED3_9EUKA|nr:hypothetical protein SS50377_22453 [Spironucleus salmonicida]|eukprot:EST42056.1 hypothetical protein SS50377_18363 [Spironucleus salmonicida]